MSQTEKSAAERDTSRRTIFIVVAVGSALLVAGLVYLATRPRAQTAEPRLEGALRPGNPEYDQLRDRLVFEFDQAQHATREPRVLGDVVVRMKPVVRNLTGRTLSAMEFRAVFLGPDGRPLRERAFVRRAEVAPNKTYEADLTIEGLKPEEVSEVISPGTIKVELTGVRFR
ncbi:MAG TPA: hypothetical protein VEQ42_10100 [Pyrinomonadaceae bacterium]|nr:hypothetical protein [Pyrinomonadaceae bacterium]